MKTPILATVDLGKIGSFQSSPKAFPLVATLQKLGIHPFLEASVGQYKDEKARCLRLSFDRLPESVLLSMMIFGVLVHCFLAMFLAYAVGRSPGWFFPPALLAMTLFVLMGTGVIADTFPQRNRPWSNIVMGTLFCLSGLIYAVIAELLCCPAHKYWEKVTLSAYLVEHGPLPKHAENMVTRIRESDPEVQFIVDQLIVHESVADPFLIAGLGSERFVIAVWDEKDFE